METVFAFILAITNSLHLQTLVLNQIQNNYMLLDMTKGRTPFPAYLDYIYCDVIVIHGQDALVIQMYLKKTFPCIYTTNI
jgi:hypothetical protein